MKWASGLLCGMSWEPPETGIALIGKECLEQPPASFILN